MAGTYASREFLPFSREATTSPGRQARRLYRPLVGGVKRPSGWAVRRVSHNSAPRNRQPSSTAAKKPEKLWIVWKTQDARLSKLWITCSAALFVHRPSVRIGAAHTGGVSASVTLKIPARRPDAVRTTGVDRTYVRVIHKPSIIRLRRVRPIHRMHRIGAHWKPPETRLQPLTHAALRESSRRFAERETVVHICGKPC